jgi:uncharacterized protein (TIGR03083 family)
MEQTPGTEGPSEPRDRDALLARIRRSRAALEATLQPLSAAQMTTPAPHDGWSVKDHLAHLTAWEQGIVALLQHRPRWAAMGLEEGAIGDEDEINAMLHQAAKERPLAEVLAAFHDSYSQMLVTLDGLTDADLFRTYSHYQPEEPGEDDGRPIIGWIIGNTYEHYDEHRGWIEALIDRIGRER